MKKLSGSLCKFYSHPGVLLKDHLRDVGLLCRKYVENAGIGDQKIVKVAELIGKGHDFGKYTEYFQKTLNGGKKSSLSNHALLSAIFSSWLVYRELKDAFLSAIAFLCVSCHHRSLSNFSEIKNKIRNNERIINQIRSIRKNASNISKELEELQIYEVMDFVDNFDSVIDKILKEICELIAKRPFEEKEEEEYWRDYYIVLLLFSSLIDADKKDAGDALKYEDMYSHLVRPSTKLIEDYRKKNFEKANLTKINQLREKMYESLKKKLESPISHKILTITAPTGTGKTILGFYTALRLKEMLFPDRMNSSKLIYSLPYINIVEQNYLTFERIIFPTSDANPFVLLKHHHLSLGTLANQLKDEIPLDDLLLLVESWDSNVIVTTFIQLLHSIIGCENSFLKKFHNMANSIIILDEIQSLPLKYWILIKNALFYLSKYLNTTIVLMTATMPVIFKDVNSYELINDYELLYNALNRTVFKSELEKEMSISELVDFFFEKWSGDKSALIVVNTIATSIKVYEELAKRLDEKVIKVTSKNRGAIQRDLSKVFLCYLSTNIVPQERKERINLIKTMLKEGFTVILVSTQAIEAGVDLDFDMAIRDIAPLDSIVQVAGRCNRNWHIDRGELFIVKIVDEKGNQDSLKIYDDILINRSEALLKEKREFNESELRNIIDKYYGDIANRINLESKTEELLQAIKDLNFDELRDFSLIEKEPKIPVFIEIDDNNARKILEEFKESINEIKDSERNEIFKHKAKLKIIRTKLENYIINVWKIDKNLPDIGHDLGISIGIKYVSRGIRDAYYNDETGYLFPIEKNEVSEFW